MSQMQSKPLTLFLKPFVISGHFIIQLTLCLDMLEIFALPFSNFSFERGLFQKKSKVVLTVINKKSSLNVIDLTIKIVGGYLGESYDKIFAFKRSARRYV